MTKNVSVPEGYKKTELGMIPEEWKVVKLGACIKQIKESVLPESIEKALYVGLEHINTGDTKLTSYGVSDSVKSLKSKFTANNILYGKLRPYLDKAVLTDKEGICSTDIIVIECKDSSIKEFVIYVLHSKQFLDYINGTTAGSNLPRTSWQSISKYNVPFPPLPEQQKIASILSKVDEQIEQTEQVIEKTELLKKGLIQKLLTRGIGHTKFKKTELGEIPEDWEVVKLGDITQFKNGLNFKKDQKGNSGIPVVDVLNMFSKGIRIDTNNLYNVDINLEDDSEYFLKKGDLLFVRSSLKKEGVGWTSLYDGSDNKFSFCGFIIRARLTQENILSNFLTYYFRSDIARKKIIGCSGQVAITNVSQEMLKPLSVPIPPLGEQQKIASILSKVDSQIQDNHSYLTKLQELKKGLMQDLLTGKVRVRV